MQLQVSEKENSKVVVVPGGEVVIREVQDALDLVATARSVHGSGKLLIHEDALAEAFFDLRSGLAGEILQKMTNYGVTVAIAGDFSRYESRALRDFIRECNRGKRIFFLPAEEALRRLHETPEAI